MEFDDVKAEQLGVNVSDILQTMQAYFGSSQASDFNRFGKYYRVVVQAEAEARNKPESLNGVFVKNRQGEMVPVATLVKLKPILGSETASRYNLFNSISVNAIAKPGFSSGAAIKAVQEVAETQLPKGYTIEFSGLTKEEITSSGQSAVIFGLSLLFVFFLLAAQYESYILPAAVILSIPTGIFGVFVAIGFAGIENNIYVQVALIMLIGLLAKNAILIVEYAIQRRRAGKSLLASALEAAKMRLRPIIMTTLAFGFGVLPLALSTGAGAGSQHSVGFGVLGGVISSTLLGIFFIPVFFVWIRSIFKYKPKKQNNQEQTS